MGNTAIVEYWGNEGIKPVSQCVSLVSFILTKAALPAIAILHYPTDPVNQNRRNLLALWGRAIRHLSSHAINLSDRRIELFLHCLSICIGLLDHVRDRGNPLCG